MLKAILLFLLSDKVSGNGSVLIPFSQSVSMPCRKTRILTLFFAGFHRMY